MARKSRKNQPCKAEAANQIYNTAIYIRLSVADNGDSIVNQQRLLERYINERPDFTLKQVFVDNGETGVNFNRPAWCRLIKACNQGHISCIVVKDLSRLGRNYIETGDYLERIFPALRVRLIAINDSYDSQSIVSNKQIIYNLTNLVNDIYAKDISRKVLAAMHTKQKKGEFLGAHAAYGYLKDPANPKKIIPNPETDQIVRSIFEMKAAGLSNGAICRQLNSENTPCPNHYRVLKGLTQNKKYVESRWISSTVAAILRNPLYLGHMTQRKFTAALYDGKAKRKTHPDEWIIVPNTHEAIVSQTLFDRVNATPDKSL